MFQAASIGPMYGQRAHFGFYAPDGSAYALSRYDKEGERLNAVMDRMLSGRDWFLASGFSIVDIAHFGWVHTAVRMGYAIDAHPNLKAWFERVSARPAVQRGIAIPAALPAFREPRRGE